MDSNSSAERLANSNTPLVTETVNFCLHSIKSHESSEPLVQAANNFKFRTTSIFLGPVDCPRGLVIHQTRYPNA